MSKSKQKGQSKGCFPQPPKERKFSDHNLAGVNPLKQQFEPAGAEPVRQRYAMAGG